MRAVVQRVSSAQVVVSGEVVSRIARGFLVLLGVWENDTQSDVEYIASKIAGLRIFEDGSGKMNLALRDIQGSVLVVSQFTLYGDCRKGRRPSFVAAARPSEADRLYSSVVSELRGCGVTVETGRFQAHLEVSLVNVGPVSILLDSSKLL